MILHPNQKKYQGKSRIEVFVEYQHSALLPINWRNVARWVGHHVTTSVNRGEVKVNNQKFLLPSPEYMDKTGIGSSCKAYWFKHEADKENTIYLYKNDEFICELHNKPFYHKARIEQKAEDFLEMGKMRSFTHKIDDHAKKVVGSLEKFLFLNTSSLTQDSLQSQYSATTSSMRELESAGRKDEAVYKDLENQALQYKSAIAQVEVLVSHNIFQGYVQGISMLSAGLNAAQGAISLFAGENEKLQRIMLKVNALMDVAIGLQQIQQGLTATSAFRIQVLTKVKNLWAVANARVTASLVALGVAETVATVAAQALIATLTLGLSVAIAAVVALFTKWQSKQAEVAEEQKRMSTAIADSVAEPLTAYKKLQVQWNALGEDLKKKNKFITDNKEEFNKLGVEIGDVADAENFLKENSNTFIEVLKLRAKAAAEAWMAMENYKKAIELNPEVEKYNKVQNDPNHSDLYKWGNRLIHKSSKDEQDELNAKGDQGVSNQVKFLLEADQKFEKAKFKSSKIAGSSPGNKPNTAQSAADEYFPPGSLAEIQKRISVIHKALNKATDIQQINRLKDQKIKAEEERAIAEKRIRIHSFEQSISEMKEGWKRYYQYQKEYGPEAARLQFSEIRKQAPSFFDWLVKEKMKLDQIVSGGGKLSDEQKNNLEILKTQIRELIDQKTELEIFSQKTEEQLNCIPLITSQIEYLASKRDELKNTGVDQGFWSFLDLKIEDKRKEFTSMLTEFINIHQSFEQQRLNISAKYADLRQGIENRKLSPEETSRLLKELEDTKNKEVDAVNTAEYAKSDIYERFSQNLVSITKRDLRVKIASLEEYLKLSQGLLNPEQQSAVKSEIDKAKALKATFNIGVEEKALLQEKAKLVEDIQTKQSKGDTNVQEEKDRLNQINEQLNNVQAKKAQWVADMAGGISSSFKTLAGAIGDENHGLADTLDTLGDVFNIASNAAGAVAAFASGDIVGGISQTISAVAGVFSIGQKAKESERKANEDIKKYQDSIFQAGLDYRAMLRQRLADELKVNEAYKSRVQYIKDEMAVNVKNKDSVLRDQKELLKRLLNADTVVRMHTERFGWGKKTKAVEDRKKVVDLLGHQPMQISDQLLDDLARLNAEKPLTGDAKAAYEQLLKLKEEYISVEQLDMDYKKQLKDTITGTTAQSLGDSIREGILSGKKQFSDFADDIENFLRQGIISGMSAKIIEPQIQQLQDELAGFLGDGVITDDEKQQFQQMYMKIATEAQEYVEMINQAGMNITKDGAASNSLQGALKSASQESIDLLAGHTGGMRLAQLETNQLLKSGAAQQMAQSSRMIEIQVDIEKNTRRTAQNTERLHDIHNGITKVDQTLSSQYNQLKAAGI
ncbi:hypothetical protein GNY06_12590 [Elizabethkingia argentiflava]|uniref:Uncharacterized protein n=1 Tax=Elizabethkingia argenteiflava TaxID=2681556 RepID=A0A845PZE2_9FLAO|nr:hypothetical protein [Elizabethkingia argenteiflava]NAW52176.1 hypothetical protein [Elizabethkingia argenteiflava]